MTTIIDISGVNNVCQNLLTHGEFKRFPAHARGSFLTHGTVGEIGCLCVGACVRACASDA